MPHASLAAEASPKRQVRTKKSRNLSAPNKRGVVRNRKRRKRGREKREGEKKEEGEMTTGEGSRGEEGIPPSMKR